MHDTKLEAHRPRHRRLQWLLFSAVLLAAHAGAQIAPALTALRPIKGISYQPSPSDDCQLHSQYARTPECIAMKGVNPVYFDTDFYNADFELLWGPGPAANGRNDLATLKAQGINFLHIYNWNKDRNHIPFMEAVAAHGMKFMVPVSNYTACLIVGGCQEVKPGTGSYQRAFDNIRGIFEEVYLEGKKPHPSVGAWGIYNEYELYNIDPVNVAFAIQAILKLENDAGIAPENRLPFMVPVSNATHASASEPWARVARAIYQAIPGANPVIPPGVLGNIGVSIALQNAQTSGTTRYGTVTVAPIPADFWTTRFIATVNPFTSGPTLNSYITSPGQFQSAFPGANVSVTSPSAQTWNAAWNSLPPLFFSEMGIDVGGSGPARQTSPQTQAAWVLRQLQCTHPWALDPASTPHGYFLGSSVFELEYEGTNGHWGMWTFPAPVVFTTAQTTTGATYRVDRLDAQPAWSSVLTGFQATTRSCS